MVNSIIIGISREIGKEFGKKYIVHAENMEQGLKEPCFFINCLNPSQKHVYGYNNIKRYEKQNQFCIQYFPESKKVNAECNDVAGRMLRCMEYITPNGAKRPIRGANMHYEVTDGVLNFFVNYDFYACQMYDSETAMEAISNVQHVKE